MAATMSASAGLVFRIAASASSIHCLFGCSKFIAFSMFNVVAYALPHDTAITVADPEPERAPLPSVQRDRMPCEPPPIAACRPRRQHEPPRAQRRSEKGSIFSRSVEGARLQVIF